MNLFCKISQKINREPEKSLCEHKTTHSNTATDNQQSGNVLTSASIFQLSLFTRTVSRWFFSAIFSHRTRRFSYGRENFARGFLFREITRLFFFLRALNIANEFRFVSFLEQNFWTLKISEIFCFIEKVRDKSNFNKFKFNKFKFFYHFYYFFDQNIILDIKNFKLKSLEIKCLKFNDFLLVIFFYHLS